jgi:hypothetical protein
MLLKIIRIEINGASATKNGVTVKRHWDRALDHARELQTLIAKNTSL